MLKRDFIVGLTNNKRILKQFVSVISVEDINKRINDYWTIYEHIDHLVVCQKMLLGRIELFISEENPIIKPYNPDVKPEINNGMKSAAELVQEFCELRDKQIKLLKTADRHVWKKQGTHDEYKKYTFEILLRHILVHDSFHMFRMEELWIMKEQYIKELN